jgi:hypothetical protein
MIPRPGAAAIVGVSGWANGLSFNAEGAEIAELRPKAKMSRRWPPTSGGGSQTRLLSTRFALPAFLVVNKTKNKSSPSR